MPRKFASVPLRINHGGCLLIMEFTDICYLEDHNQNHQEPQQCGSCRIPGLPESVFLELFDAEPLRVPLLQAEELDEVSAILIAYKLGLDGMLPAHLLGDDLKVS